MINVAIISITYWRRINTGLFYCNSYQPSVISFYFLDYFMHCASRHCLAWRILLNIYGDVTAVLHFWFDPDVSTFLVRPKIPFALRFFCLVVFPKELRLCSAPVAFNDLVNTKMSKREFAKFIWLHCWIVFDSDFYRGKFCFVSGGGCERRESTEGMGIVSDYCLNWENSFLRHFYLCRLHVAKGFSLCLSLLMRLYHKVEKIELERDGNNIQRLTFAQAIDLCGLLITSYELGQDRFWDNIKIK